jgi:transmembrane sensor
MIFVNEREIACVARFFAGELPESEAVAIRRRLDSDPAWRREVEWLREIWQCSAAMRPRHGGSAARVWLRLAADMERDGGPRVDIVQGAARKSRPLAGALRRPLSRSGVAAAGLLAAAGIAALSFFGMPLSGAGTAPIEPVVVHELVTERGQRAQVGLSDGTRLTLGPGTRLEMLDGFGTESREVRLSGEAFFDIAPDPDRPFLVHVRGAVTRVLGTEFGIRAYPDEPDVKVVVAEGTVSVRSTEPGAAEAILQAGELGELTTGGVQVISRPADLDVHLGWRGGRLTFENTPLAQVAREIERWYGVPIRVGDDSLGSLRLTASFRDQPVEVIVTAVAASLGLEWRRAGETYVFFARGTGRLAAP